MAKKVYKLGNVYVNIDKIVTMTKPYISEHINNKCQEIKSCSLWINDEKYHCSNYVDTDYSGLYIDDDTEKRYKEFKNDANILFEEYVFM